MIKMRLLHICKMKNNLFFAKTMNEYKDIRIYKDI